MKMNAKKLTLALVALLLALTCVFAACKKDEPKPVDDKPAEQPAETLAKEDLVKIAEKFKADFVTNYLNLYSDEVAIQIESEKSEALLKIAAASSKDEAETIAKNFMDALKAKRTLIDDVKDLIDQIADVDLDDEADVKALNAYNSRLLEAVDGATGNKKTLLDAYKAETAPTINDIFWRLSVLKLAKRSAVNVNNRIANFLERVEAAKDADLDSDLEDGVYLTLADFEELVKLDAHVQVFAEVYELTGTKAYRQILDIDKLEEARTKYEAKPKSEQLDRAYQVYDIAPKLAALALQVGIGTDTDDEDTITKVQYIGEGDQIFDFAEGDGAYYFMLKSVLDEAPEELPEDDEVDRVLVTYGDINRYVAKSDLYFFLPTAWAELNTLDIVQVITSTELLEELDGFSVSVTIPVAGTEYKLDAEFQALAEEAAEIASNWAKFIDVSGVVDLSESFINNQFFKQVILAILGDYDATIATAKAKFDEFAEDIVEMNYVNEYPEKKDTTKSGDFTTDTQTMPTKLLVDEEGKAILDDDGNKQYVYNPETDNWMATLYDEMIRIMKSAKANSDASAPAMAYFNFTPNGELTYIVEDGKYAGGEEVPADYDVSLRDNGDGTYTIYYTYSVYEYLWKAYNLARTAQDVVVDRANTTDIDDAIGDDALRALGAKLIAWVEKYLPETLPTDLFDLAPFKTVKEEKVLENVDFVEFGDVKVTFADDKLAEESVATIVEINGAAVDAEPTAALDITVYSDYNVALALQAAAEADADAQENLIAKLEAAVANIFAVNHNLDAISAAEAVLAEVYDAYGDTYDAYREALGEEDADRVAACAETLETAVNIRYAVLDLYPHNEWDAALEDAKDAADANQEALAEINAIIAKYDRLVNVAKAHLAYLEAGNTIGWTDPAEDSDIECRLVATDDVNVAKRIVTVLESWRSILTDATTFLTDDMLREAIPVTPNSPADPDLIGILTSTTEEADGKAALADQIDAMYEEADALDAQADETEDAGEKATLQQQANGLREEALQLLGNYDDTDAIRAEVSQLRYAAFLEAYRAKLAEYVSDEELVDVLYNMIADAVENGYFADQKTLQAFADEAEAAFEDALADFSFRLDAVKSFADLEAMDEIIEDLEAFLAGDEESDEDDHDYLNLTTANDYTGNLIDLFSQLFNERIMAAYYNSIELTKEYCNALTGSYYAVKEMTIAIDEEHTTTWIEYAINQLKRIEALSDETFESFAAAKAAVADTWRSAFINYRWAVEAINTYAEDDVASYVELVYEEVNGEEGYQPADDDDETEDDIPGILITGEIPQP